MASKKSDFTEAAVLVEAQVHQVERESQLSGPPQLFQPQLLSCFHPNPRHVRAETNQTCCIFSEVLTHNRGDTVISGYFKPLNIGVICYTVIAKCNSEYYHLCYKSAFLVIKCLYCSLFPPRICLIPPQARYLASPTWNLSRLQAQDPQATHSGHYDRFRCGTPWWSIGIKKLFVLNPS